VVPGTVGGRQRAVSVYHGGGRSMPPPPGCCRLHVLYACVAGKGISLRCSPVDIRCLNTGGLILARGYEIDNYPAIPFTPSKPNSITPSSTLPIWLVQIGIARLVTGPRSGGAVTATHWTNWAAILPLDREPDGGGITGRHTRHLMRRYRNCFFRPALPRAGTLFDLLHLFEEETGEKH
jgi:hypothetical protein